MGYPMALNLRKGLDSSYTLLICDVVLDAISRFQKDAEGPVEVTKSGYEAVQRAVRSLFSSCAKLFQVEYTDKNVCLGYHHNNVA